MYIPKAFPSGLWSIHVLYNKSKMEMRKWLITLVMYDDNIYRVSEKIYNNDEVVAFFKNVSRISALNTIFHRLAILQFFYVKSSGRYTSY